MASFSPPRACARSGMSGAFLLCAGLLLSSGLQGQERENPRAPGSIHGRVIDQESGAGIANAAVRISDLDRSPVLTNSQGQFRLAGVPVGIQEIEISHIAYGRTTHLVNVIEGAALEVDIRLGFSAIVLDSLVAEVEFRSPALLRSGFYDRLRSGWGHYFHGEDLERWTPDQLVRMVPGVTEIPGGLSPFDRRVAIRVRGGFGGNCYPDIFLDGVRFFHSEGNLREVLGGLDVAAMEVYRGTATPAEFQSIRYPPCGAIVLWTRRE
jgi:hypothetical protein